MERPLPWRSSSSRAANNELARRVVLSRSSITRLVDQLEQQGMLARQPDPEDRRGAYAVLTAVGEPDHVNCE